jgi:hypothetical protein
MSAVGKEILLEEGVGSSSVEVSPALRGTRAATVQNGGGRFSKSAQRDLAPFLPQQVTVADIRRFLAKRSESVQKFIAPMEEEIRRANKLRSRAHRGTRGAVAKIADLVTSVVRKIAHRETGVFAIEPDVSLLLSVLCAGSVESSIVFGLVRRAQGAIAALATDDTDLVSTSTLSGYHKSFTSGAAAGGAVVTLRDYDIVRELDELAMLLRWYVKRSMSLSALELELLRQNEGLPVPIDQPEDDLIFGCEVLHDHVVFGAKGCFVLAGLRLVGHDGEPLWMRVSVEWNGRPVAVRPEWSTWTDPGAVGSLSVVSESAPFCSLVPIRPHAQRLIIDDIRAFVPYAALDLPAGRCNVELVVSIANEDGEEILSTSRRESICVPRREMMSMQVPAPHTVGMWPHDVVSGDRISDLSVTSGYKVVSGWERHTLSVQFDLSLYMHAGENVLLECRFLDERGEIVELSSLGIPYVASELNMPMESVSSYRYQRILHPRGAWSHYRGLCIDIPVEFLMLPAGSRTLTCEVMVVSADDRILCGDMGLVTVAVPVQLPAEEALQNNEIELESIEIDPNWSFADDECVRVQATFCPKDASKRIAQLAAGRAGSLFSPYRVEISLEREDGHLLLQAFSDPLGMGFKPVTRGVCVQGHSGFREQSVVANFSKEEILGWSLGSDGGRGAAAKTRLFAKVRALSLGGEIFINDSREFFVKPLIGGGREIVEISGVDPSIADIVAHTYTQAPTLSCRALINMPHGRLFNEGMVFACDVIDSAGKKERIYQRKLTPSYGAALVQQPLGVSQISVEFEYAHKQSLLEGSRVECILLTSSGEMLNSMQQVVKMAGVLSDIDTVRPASPVGQGVSMQAPEELSERDDVAEAATTSSGWFGWFRR